MLHTNSNGTVNWYIVYGKQVVCEYIYYKKACLTDPLHPLADSSLSRLCIHPWCHELLSLHWSTTDRCYATTSCSVNTREILWGRCNVTRNGCVTAWLASRLPSGSILLWTSLYMLVYLAPAFGRLLIFAAVKVVILTTTARAFYVINGPTGHLIHPRAYYACP